MNPSFITIAVEKMTDAQQLISYARTQFNDIAADVERHFDLVAGSLRERFSRPIYASPAAPRLPPPTTWQLVQRWVSRHKALSAALVAFLVSGSLAIVVVVKSREVRKRRRARKAPSGARTDVVVVAGAVANPLASALYLDLERRGFVTYVVAHTDEDAQYVRSQARADLVPLHLDLVDPFTAQAQMARLQTLLGSEHRAFEGAEPHRLHLAGLVLVPETSAGLPAAKVEEISSEEWSEALHAQVLHTIATTQLLLPTVLASRAKILLLTPSVTPALRLPLHPLENTVYGALEGFSASLAAELRHEGVAISHLKLGHIDIPAVTAKLRREGVPAPSWKPTPLRQLHDTVFDTLVSRTPKRIIHVGRGSLTYDLIGSITPPGFIGWMMRSAAQRPALVKRPSDGELGGSSSGSLTWEKVDREV